MSLFNLDEFEETSQQYFWQEISLIVRKNFRFLDQFSHNTLLCALEQNVLLDIEKKKKSMMKSVY